jgi:hypothetical protein
VASAYGWVTIEILSRVSKLNSVYCDLSLHAFTVLKFIND